MMNKKTAAKELELAAMFAAEKIFHTELLPILRALAGAGVTSYNLNSSDHNKFLIKRCLENNGFRVEEDYVYWRKK